MKTILFINKNPFNPVQGGIQRVGDILTKSLSQRGYKILHLSLLNPVSYRNYNYPAELAFFPNPDYAAKENYTFLENFISENNVDIIVNHCMFRQCKLFLHRAKTDKTKKITIIHNSPQRSYNYLFLPKSEGLKDKINACWRKLKYNLTGEKRRQWKLLVDNAELIYKNSDKVSLLSENFKGLLWQLIPEFEENDKKVIAIANANTYSNKEIDFEKKTKSIIFVARLAKGAKRQDRVVDIWRSLENEFPDWQLTIIGDGKQRRFLEKYARGLKRINFVGFQDPEPYYRNASILCMTSDFEGFPMVLAEAMIHGTVPMAFNSFASVTDIIEDNSNGVLVQPFSLKEYKMKLSELMKDDIKREQMARYAMKSVEKFDVEIITDYWVETLESL